MINENIRLTISYKTPITFCLRMVGLADEQKIRQKYLALTDEEKEAGKEYELNVSVLADLSGEMPQGMFPRQTETPDAEDQTVYLESFKNPKDCVKSYFAETSVSKERIAEYAVRAYLASLTPNVSFQ